jgi:hypothetical protein
VGYALVISYARGDGDLDQPTASLSEFVAPSTATNPAARSTRRALMHPPRGLRAPAGLSRPLSCRQCITRTLSGK